ncbi:MAG: ribonuclease HII [Acidimicrobiales bacterium]
MVLTRRPRPRPAWPTLDHERQLWEAGHRWVAGVDEVGRGAWAGPVSVGVAVVPAGSEPGACPDGLRDSKLLTEQRREAMFDAVSAWCAAWAVGHAGPEECDRWGMTAAIRLAARRAWATIEPVPDAALVDGPRDLFGWSAEHGPAAASSVPTVVPVIGGDARCMSVAAASVLAKVVRDRMMREQSSDYPPYDFDQNKGYPSPTHRRALDGYGLSAIHRRSWSYAAALPWR